MKKTVLVVLFLFLFGLSVVACGGAPTEAPTLEPTNTPVPPTDTPIPPTPTPSPTPDITADFVTYTNEAGTVSLRHPPTWSAQELGGTMVAIISDQDLFEPLIMEEDFTQPAGFVVGESRMTTDYDSDDPVSILEEWLKGLEDDWNMEPVGELQTTEDDTIRRASRDYTGSKDEQSMFITATAIVNGARAAVFIGGRTGTAPQDYEALVAAIMDTLEIQYVDPASAPTAVEPTVAPLPTLAPTPAEAPDEVFAEGRIVFASDRDGNSEIYAVKTDGSELTRLTDNPAFDGQPAWSPDGTKILFVSERDGNTEIYSMNPDGSGITRLTEDPAADHSPAWSPNGQIIAFVSERNGNPDIFLMHADGSGVSPFITSEGQDMSPTWSYAAQELAYVSNQGGAFDLYITNSEGQTHQVTDGLGNVFTPDWVSNSRYIAFAAGVGINFDIYIVKPDGTDLQQVTTSEAKDYQPRWSPDGNFIMFVSERDGDPDVYITNESGDLLRVTNDSGADTTPAWEP